LASSLTFSTRSQARPESVPAHAAPHREIAMNPSHSASPAGSGETVLYHYFRSSSSWRVRWALLYKGIRFRAVAVDLLKGEQRSETHRALSPLAMVPVLHIDGLTLCESVAILEYLEETRPSPALAPADARLRARMRQLVQIIAADTQPLQNLSVLEHAERLSPGPDARRRWAEHYIRRGLDAYEATLALPDLAEQGGPYSCGASLSMADLCLVPQCYNARRQGLDIGAHWPRVAAIEAACLATDSGRESAPDACKPDA
jgi:maleylacetoacetate isomerase